jgi:Uma2 family endonuclease
MATLAQIDLKQEGVFTGLTMPLTFRPSVPLSDDELIAFSRRNEPYQIERNTDGELEVMSPCGTEGSSWEAEVIAELTLWARKHGGKTFSSSGGFKLPDGSVRSPDAAWASSALWDALSLTDRRRYAPICPEFVVEVLSENDSPLVLRAKMEMWVANGAKLAWMIDPFAATVSIYRPDAAVEVLERPDWVEAETVVAGFRLEMSRLWAK